METFASGLVQAADRFGRCGTLTFVTQTAPMLSPEVRGILEQTVRSLGDRYRAAALVFDGSGFRAAAVRSVVTGLSLLRSGPHKVYSDPREACTWLAEKFDDIDADELLALLRRMEQAPSKERSAAAR